MSTFYAQQASSLSGRVISMADYAGKLVLVVNTASRCGFTPQYAGLEALYRQFESEGLVILGFPCNQFGRQEPGGAEEIGQFCALNYGVSFPMFAKIDVNGPNAHPLFKLLCAELPGYLGRRVNWNFTKFIVGRDGVPLRRFAPFTAPIRMLPYIRQALML